MNDNNLYILLDIIFRNGSVKRLINNGLNFNEVAERINQSIIEGLIENSENRIILTEKGIYRLKELEEKYKKTNKKEWIKKDEKNRLDKNRREKNFIFVPRQNELSF